MEQATKEFKDWAERRSLNHWSESAKILWAERSSLLEALEKLAKKLEAIGSDESFKGIHTIAHAHGLHYHGPNWAEELTQARAVIKQAHGE